MIDADGGIKVLEFNCRLGDPGDAADHDAPEDAISSPWSSTRSTARSNKVEAEWDRRAALGVVLAAAGYPDNPAQGRRDHRAAARRQNDFHVFHAGTALGGRQGA